MDMDTDTGQRWSCLFDSAFDQYETYEITLIR
jgi:hypothetical protein